MFSQFFEKSIARPLRKTPFSNSENTSTPKTNLRNLLKDQSPSPFNGRSKSPNLNNINKSSNTTPKLIKSVSTKSPLRGYTYKLLIFSFLANNNIIDNKLNLNQNKSKISQEQSHFKKNNKTSQTQKDFKNLEIIHKSPNYIERIKTLPNSELEIKGFKEFRSPKNYSECSLKNDFIQNKESQNKIERNERDLSSKSSKNNNYSITHLKKNYSKNGYFDKKNIIDNNKKECSKTITLKQQNEIPKKMYESQKNIEFTNNIQLKFLYYSKINDYEKCLEIIDEKGCPREQCINVKGDNDWTALHYASLHGNIKLTNLLLFHEAIIDAETNAKMTPLMIACQKGYDDISSLLVNAGADINLFDLCGNTALHYGCLNSQKKIVELFLQKSSININLRNLNNKLAKEMTSEHEILKLFDNYENKKKMNPNSQKILIYTMQNDQLNNLLKITPTNSSKEQSIKSHNENFASSTNTTATNNYSHQTISFIQNDEEFEKDNQIKPKEKVTLQSFHIHGLLGKGSFGEVYLVEKKEGKDAKTLYAMKVLHKSKLQRNNLVKYALTERNVLSITNHPFIVKLIYAFQNSEKLFMIMEFCPGGDLGQHLQQDKRFKEDRAKIYLAEILLALEDLHKRDIIFRDLKPDNIVLDKDGHAMLTDFGLSKEGVMNQIQGARSFCGSVAYLAPEMLKRVGHGKAVDWYLLGVVLYEMLVGIPPYYANNKDELFMNIEKAPLKIPSYVSPEASSLLKSLLQRNPAKRLGSGKGDSEEIKSHPFFKNLDWGDVENRKLNPPTNNHKIKINPISGNDVFTQILSISEENSNYISGWSFAGGY